jgi:very-short-patch-repair endonuclease
MARFTAAKAGYDAERDKVLTQLGVRVLRISNQARR